MADPTPESGQWLILNTGEFGLDANGDFVLHDPDYLLLETGTTDAMLLETGTTDGLLVEPYDCACCEGDGVCGPCTSALSDTLTLDIGLSSVIEDPNWHPEYDSYYSYCETPCNDFGGAYIITQESACGWSYEEDLCSRVFTDPTGNPGTRDYRIGLYADIRNDQQAPFLGWVAYARIVFEVNWMLDQTGQPGGGQVSTGRYYWSAIYFAAIANPCTGQTLVLNYLSDGSGPFGDWRAESFPCRDPDESIIEFPATISLIIP